MAGILKGIGTTTFVATRVAMIVGAALVITGTVAAIKDRFTGVEDEAVVECEAVEIETETETTEN